MMARFGVNGAADQFGVTADNGAVKGVVAVVELGIFKGDHRIKNAVNPGFNQVIDVPVHQLGGKTDVF